MSNVEQAKYKVISSHGSIEIRDYAPMIVAETEMPGTRYAAINQGFRLIADYIFGNNATQKRVAMTAPVMQQPNEKVEVTASVTQQADEGLWKVRFVMPESYTLQTLPRPNNVVVKLKEIRGKRFAVIRLSGLAVEGSLRTRTNVCLFQSTMDTSLLAAQ